MSRLQARTPLEHFRLAETSDVGEFEEAILPIFGEVRFDTTRPLGDFHARANFRTVDQCGIYYGHYGTQVKIAIPCAGFVAQGVALEGSGISVVNGTECFHDTATLPNAVFASSEVKLEFDNSHRHLAFCMNPAVLQLKLDALVGSSSDKQLFIAEDVGLSAVQMARFRRLLLLLIEELDDALNPPPKVLLRELEQALMVAFLVGYRHNFSQLLEGRPADVAPWQVKRVEHYIEAHWDQPLTIESIAAAVDAGVRSIQHSFRSSRGYTPMEFVRRIRLRHARAMLSAPHSATTVTDVAYACCFGNLGHFSRLYCEQFHELPSTTLARSKGTAFAIGNKGTAG